MRLFSPLLSFKDGTHFTFTLEFCFFAPLRVRSRFGSDYVTWLRWQDLKQHHQEHSGVHAAARSVLEMGCVTP